MNALEGFERCPWCEWSGIARIYGVDVTCPCPRGLVAGAGPRCFDLDHVRSDQREARGARTARRLGGSASNPRGD